MRDDILDIKNITYEYNKGEKVLKDINIDIARGCISVLVGPNGSGKTTLMKLIFDILSIQEGAIFIDGNHHTEVDCKKRAIYLPSDNLLPEFLTGHEYIKVMCDLYDYTCDDSLKNKLIDYYSMNDYIDNLIETYSHGMTKKIQLITAFLIQPDLIVIDETLNGIDIEAKEVTKILMQQIVKKNKSILMCTHDLDFAKKVGKRIIIMHKGTIYQDVPSCMIDNNISLTTMLKNIINFKEDNYEI